jgi:hypothetical protein
VEMNATFPVNTRVYLTLKSRGIQVQAVGVVRTSYPFLGMGISFEDLEPGQRVQLQQIIDSSAGRGAIGAAGPAQDDGMRDALASADPRAFLDEITGFFQNHSLLSCEEFYQIAKRVRRS